MFLCEENIYGKFSHSAYEYWDTFPTFKPLPENIYVGASKTIDKKKFFLHDSDYVLILIFESEKKCQK